MIHPKVEPEDSCRRLLRLAVRWNYHGFNVAPRQQAAMSLYAAIDSHSGNSVRAVMDGEGKARLKCRTRHIYRDT